MVQEKYKGMLKSPLTFMAIYEIFKMSIKRHLSGHARSDISKLKESLWTVTDKMAQHSLRCSDNITRHSSNVFRQNMTILVHSHSRNVLKVLQSAVDRGISINVLVTEGLPGSTGNDTKNYCD